MATTLRRPNSRLSFADEVSYRDSPVVADLDNSFPENFIIGDRVWLNGIYGARIQYIGEVHFAHGDDWAGLVMDEPIGKHDGSLGGHRYYYCENRRGLFARLSKLTRVPLRAQESPDSGIQTNSPPVRPPRQRHYSGPSPILKNSPNRMHSSVHTSSTRQSPEVTFKRNYLTPKELDRSYEYYYEYEKKRNERSLDRSTGSTADLDTSSRGSPYSRQSSLTSPSLINFHYVRPSRSSTPRFTASPTPRSLSTGSRTPRIHHIRVELEPDALDFKKSLKKACSEDLKADGREREESPLTSARITSSPLTTSSPPITSSPTTTRTAEEKPLLKLGDHVWVDSSKGLLGGKLRYLGPTKFREGHWCGVELELPYGRHDGKVEGKRYFTCKKNHGLFAPCHKVFKQSKVDSGRQFKSTRFADDV